MVKIKFLLLTSFRISRKMKLI